MRIPTILIGLLLSINTLAQTRKLDSLYKVLAAHDKEDSARVILVIEIVRREFFKDRDKSLSLTKEALSLSKQIGFNRGTIKLYAFLGTYYESIDDFEKVTDCAFNIIQLCERLKITYKLGDAYNMLGVVHKEWDDYEKSIFYFKKALAVSRDKRDSSSGYNNIGTALSNAKRYDEAIEYHTKALLLDLKMNDLPGVQTDYCNLATLSNNKKNSQAAIDYSIKALSIGKKLGSTYGFTSIHDDQDVSSLAHLTISEAYYGIRQYQLAVKHADSSLIMAQKSRHKTRLKDSYQWLATIEKATKKYQSALAYFEIGNLYKDTLLNEEKFKQISNMEAKYESEKKEQSIKLLQSDNQIKTLWRNLLLACIALLIVVFIFLYAGQRLRANKNKEVLNLRIDLLTEQNNELADKYRQAILPNGNELIESQDRRLLKKALEVVERYISDTLFGVEKMAEEMGMSRANLHKRLKQASNFSPSDFIRNIRLKRAATLLENKADTVSQIGFMVGFDDPSNFTKAFKKVYGLSPSDYANTRNKYP